MVRDLETVLARWWAWGLSVLFEIARVCWNLSNINTNLSMIYFLLTSIIAVLVLVLVRRARRQTADDDAPKESCSKKAAAPPELGSPQPCTTCPEDKVCPISSVPRTWRPRLYPRRLLPRMFYCILPYLSSPDKL